MYIEEITLEGFKSYATRVTVPNFDPFFNAITGLNGSGKSNILDSICFVLGITNLSQVTSSCCACRFYTLMPTQSAGSTARQWQSPYTLLFAAHR